MDRKLSVHNGVIIIYWKYLSLHIIFLICICNLHKLKLILLTIYRKFYFWFFLESESDLSLFFKTFPGQIGISIVSLDYNFETNIKINFKRCSIKIFSETEYNQLSREMLKTLHTIEELDLNQSSSLILELDFSMCNLRSLVL